MSRLSEILGVKEGQEFGYGNQQRTYRVVGEHFYMKKDNQCFWNIYTNKFIEMITHPELIHPITEKPQLTDQQITAIRGRIAEGTPWAARSQEQIYFYENKPLLVNDDDCSSYFRTADFDGFGGNSDFYDFITDDNSPVYLPELVEESEK